MMVYLQFSKSCLILTLLILGDRVVSAHQDMIIELDGTELIGLPTQYQPCEFNADSLELRIGDQRTRFGSYFVSLFDGADLSISASWYHEPSILPPYISFHLKPKNRDFSYKLLVNLDTLELIKAEVVIKYSSGGGRYFPIDLSVFRKDTIQDPVTQMKLANNPVQETPAKAADPDL